MKNIEPQFDKWMWPLDTPQSSGKIVSRWWDPLYILDISCLPYPIAEISYFANFEVSLSSHSFTYQTEACWNRIYMLWMLRQISYATHEVVDNRISRAISSPNRFYSWGDFQHFSEWYILGNNDFSKNVRNTGCWAESGKEVEEIESNFVRGLDINMY